MAAPDILLRYLHYHPVLESTLSSVYFRNLSMRQQRATDRQYEVVEKLYGLDATPRVMTKYTASRMIAASLDIRRQLLKPIKSGRLDYLFRFQR
eukprot:m.169298 g.169298  ORF g.169298 m.169298 type:complete len:94 (-) comp16474_c2_seq2:85-366(-)